MKKTLLIILVICASVNLFAQEEKQFGIKFSGFVKNDFFFDSLYLIFRVCASLTNSFIWFKV